MKVPSSWKVKQVQHDMLTDKQDEHTVKVIELVRHFLLVPMIAVMRRVL
jgi:hypothetical protein